jgi:integrase/recombinase XerD
MTPLRERMDADMRLRNLSTNTREQYILCVSQFARRYRRTPEQLGASEVREFLLLLVDEGRASSTVHVYRAALNFLFTYTLGRPEVLEGIPLPRRKRVRVGRPLTIEEARLLLRTAEPYPATHAFIATLLATGLRLNEGLQLRVEDIDSASDMIHVRKGKGSKFRSVKMGETLLTVLRSYWSAERPAGPWLFPGKRMSRPGVACARPWRSTPLTPSGAQQRLWKVLRLSEMKRGVTHHDLRRTYATWLLEAGVGLATVQNMLGHASPDTTTRYTRIRPELIRSTPTPLDML